MSKALATIKKAQDKASSKDRPQIAEKAVFWLLPYLARASEEETAIDEDVVKVLDASVRKYLRVAAEAKPRPGRKVGHAAIIQECRKGGNGVQASLLEAFVAGEVHGRNVCTHC